MSSLIDETKALVAEFHKQHPGKRIDITASGDMVLVNHTGGNAFPVAPIYDGRTMIEAGAPGLSKREWMAGQALTGLLANTSLKADTKDIDIAMACVAFADKTLRQLEITAPP